MIEVSISLIIMSNVPLLSEAMIKLIYILMQHIKICVILI
jgi:hypothetical protein